MTHTIQRNAAKIVAISLRLFTQAVTVVPKKPLVRISVLDTGTAAS